MPINSLNALLLSAVNYSQSLAATSKEEYHKVMMRPAATFEANLEVRTCGQTEAGPKKLRPILALVPYSCYTPNLSQISTIVGKSMS